MTQPNRDWDRLLQIMQGSEGAELPGTDEDWARLSALSQRLGVASLFYNRLAERHIPVPDAIFAALRTSYLHTAMRNARVYHILDEVLDAFNADGIPVIAMKGAHMAKNVYGNVALRPMGDIDLLVKTEDLIRAANVMRGLGFEPSSPLVESEMHLLHHLPSFSRADGVEFEIHGSPAFLGIAMPMDQQEFDNLWNRAVECTLGRHSIYVLSPEDQLLCLCLHAAVGHCFVVDLRPFFDIAAVIRHYASELDWEEVSSRARQWEVDNPVNLALYLAHIWSGASLPPTVLSAISSDITDSSLTEHIRRKVLNAPLEDLGVVFCRKRSERLMPILRLNLAGFIGRRGYTFRSRPVVEGLFPSSQMLARQYPATGNNPLRAHQARLFDLPRRYCQTLLCWTRGELVVTSPVRMEQKLRRVTFGPS